MRYPIIALAGPARSGKDTAAALLVTLTGGYRYAFADPIRAMLKVGLDIDMSLPYWVQHKESPIPAFGGKSPRQMMQWLGSEWGRDLICPNLWLTLAKQELARRGPGMIVSDARFANEAKWGRAMGGLIIHLQRSSAPPVHAHQSELALTREDNDVVLENNGTLEELQAKLRDISFGVKT